MPRLSAADTNCCRSRDRSRAAAMSNRGFTHRPTARSARSSFPCMQGRYSHVEGLFLAARHQWVLCLQCKMVARLAILRLQHVVVRRPFALVVSDDGV